MNQRFQGMPAAPGIGMGRITLYRPGVEIARPPAESLRPPAEEWQAFQVACARLDDELARQAASQNSLVAELFAAHRLILQDRTLLGNIHHQIFHEHCSAFVATQQVMGEFAELFQTFEDEYFAGRAVDIRDLGQRLLLHLSRAALAHGHDSPPPPCTIPPTPFDDLPVDTLLLADDLTPSELTLLPLNRIRGIGLANSTPTAHSAILAHSLDIPMVCALGVGLLTLEPGTTAVIDGKAGVLIVGPDALETHHYTLTGENLRQARQSAQRNAHSPALTADGVCIPVFANANRPIEVSQVRAAGADGVGLLRTEYLFEDRAEPPTLQEQAAIYQEYARLVGGPLVVRALDAGGDKPVGYIDHPQEANPFLGLRGIRLLLQQPDLLQTQYRALQLAAQALPTPSTPSAREIRFLLPMIATIEEVHAALAQLHPPGESGPPRLPLGIMIEVPSAALIAHALAPLVDFFSIGTNDLAQYTLAVDRTNSDVARLADPLHPAVLHLIHITCRAARAHGKPVAVCGEIAGDPTVTPLLLGLGVDELSAPLPDVAQIKEAVRRYSLATCRELATAALACAEGGEVRRLLARYG